MFEPSCHICGEPVKLESAAINQDGKAVHEECYVRQIALSAVGQDSHGRDSWRRT